MAHGPLVCRKVALISASCLRVEGENTCYLYFVSLVLGSFLIPNWDNKHYSYTFKMSQPKLLG